MIELRDLIDQVQSVSPFDDREAESIRRTLDRLQMAEDPFSEMASTHHITASAFVISSRGVILHLHRRLNIWVQPGGHVDDGESPPEAALRETLEETGLVARHLFSPQVFQVDVHPGPRGHTHYDLRYVVVSDPVDPTPPPGESQEVFWFDFDEARERCEPGLRAALAKLEGFVASLEMGE